MPRGNSARWCIDRVAWGKVGVDIWTHKIGGLTESDVVFAAKCDALYSAAPHSGG
jgi:pterin-4a-carbinolamine dehydratase